jgi:hypothetical protein
MANTPRVYVLCDNNCKYESLTKEQIYTAIVEALENGTISDVDTGFVQTIKTINNVPLKFFVGKQADYDSLPEMGKQNLFAIITDDTTKENLTAFLEELKSSVEGLERKHDALCEAVLATVTYIPPIDAPLNCGATGGNSFTFDLPNGKTLENLTGVALNWEGSPMVGMPFANAGVTRCYLAGVIYGTTGDVTCSIRFEENGGKVTGIIENVYQGSTRITETRNFLISGRAKTGDDYIKIFFH